MVDQMIRYKTYALLIKRMMLFIGLWPSRVSSKISRFILTVHLLTSISTTLAIASFVCNHITNLDLAMKGTGIGVSFITILLKVLIFWIYQDKHVELHQLLHVTFHSDMENPDLRAILLSPLDLFDKPTMWFSILTWAIPMMYFIAPLVSTRIQLAHNVRLRSPFPTQYPWTVEGNNFLYPIEYIMEVAAGLALGGITVATDALFGFYIFQMSSQFRTLSHRMTNLKIHDDWHRVIKECALRYQILARCRNSLERIYGPIVLWMLTTSAMVVCANIFQLSQISVLKATLAIVYIIVKFLQALLYGWYGLFLTAESESFLNSIYCSGWPSSGKKSLMSNILIMLAYKPLTLTACHYFVISLDMFMAVANAACSYFFLLRTLDESK